MAVTLPTMITGRIAYWESKGLPKMRSTESKIYKETVEKLKWSIEGKKMFADKKYPMLDFRLAVDRYAEEVFHPRNVLFKPMSLSSFLFNPFANGDYLSTLQRCLNYHSQPVNLRHPDIYQTMTDEYIKVSGNGHKTVSDLTQTDLFNLARSSNKLGAFYKRKNGEISSGLNNSKKTITSAFLKCAKDLTKYDPMKFNTYLLTRSWVWEKFPDYLLKNGYLAPKKQWNINDY
jgi:hypothetical protein